MVANKTMEIEETMKKQEEEIKTIRGNIAKNTHNIEQVKRQVEDRVCGNRNEMELERRTKEQIEELQKEVESKRIERTRREHKQFTPNGIYKIINQRIKEIEEGRIDEDTKLERIKEIIRENLEAEALIWFNGIENDVQDYEQLRNRFLQHFWGDDAQLMGKKMYSLEGKLIFRDDEVLADQKNELKCPEVKMVGLKHKDPDL
ncbi:reticulocyte-binding protein 2 homolog a-like [Anoplophora glabripennis]|uniref:reticulocyte-binding protein 2 homolog a-like n=1 Tax=Anoplophora glabripennis TaxID=217634 RepID=UPI000C791EBF|nr:reticulocyte-binding protein 2 homolog a-like [Anoplophora glabripennis]